MLNVKGVRTILNEKNNYIIGQVACWYAADTRFKGDLKKGLLLRGSCGTGKTKIFEALINLVFEIENKHLMMIHSSDMVAAYMNQDKDKISLLKQRAVLIIDDVGVEPVEAKYFGNTIEPFNDLFDARYRENKITLITTNLLPRSEDENFLTLKTRYGIRTYDRMREVLNDLVLDGDSLRK